MDSSQAAVLPHVLSQSVAVDFIDNYLVPSLPAFRNASYEPPLGYYIARQLCAAETPSELLPAWPEFDESDSTVPRRPIENIQAAKEIWDKLLPLAKIKLLEYKVTKTSIEKENILKEKGYSIRDAASFDAMHSKLEAASESYSNNTPGFRASIKRFRRKCVDHAAQPLLGISQFVPELDIVTPVLGVVQALLEAMKIATGKREEALGGFGDLVQHILTIELFIQLHPGDENIENASIQLMVTIMHAIECVICFYLKNTFKKALSAIFQQADYEKNLTQSLAAIKEDVQRLVNQESHSDKIVRKQQTQLWQKSFAQLRRGQKQIYDAQVSNQAELKQMRHEAATYFLFLAEEQQAVRQEQQLRFGQINQTLAILSTSRAASPVPQTDATFEDTVRPQDLLDTISLPDLAWEDSRLIDQRATWIPEQHQRHALRLVHAAKVKAWISAPGSSQLLIHGDFGEAPQRISGLSVLCVTLSDTLQQRATQFIHLDFFCGLHVDSATDPYTGACTMMGIFICQLLCQHDFGTVTLPPRGQESGSGIDVLCRLFVLLMHQLPRTITVVCFIDGILFYEREEFLAELDVALYTILCLSSEDQAMKAAFKVLLTSPSPTMVVRDAFYDDIILSMASTMADSSLEGSKPGLARQIGQDLSDDGNA